MEQYLPLQEDDFEPTDDYDTSLVLTPEACKYLRGCTETREHRDFFMSNRDENNLYRLTKVGSDEEKTTLECSYLAPSNVTITEEIMNQGENQVVIDSEIFKDQIPPSDIWTFPGKDFTINNVVHSYVAVHNTPVTLDPELMAPGLAQAFDGFRNGFGWEDCDITFEGWMAKAKPWSTYSISQDDQNSQRMDLTQVNEAVYLGFK
ncbi:hypothetical protein M231_01937 [Tremella mesenterica]|uniref:Uncharacterized protein n=1 Tax=Tremella mesenterica TaxID=5217 RepID=A0A4Q1BRV3_TREME|nr:hypothetical protein M231_01937 [Tremella mesenterica]